VKINASDIENKMKGNKTFTLGATIGFFTFYATVLFIRLVNNSFTSYFHFGDNELMIVIVGTAIFTILGSIIGLKKCKQTLEM